MNSQDPLTDPDPVDGSQKLATERLPHLQAVVVARGERDAVLEGTLYLRKGELSEGSDPLVERTVAMARGLDLPVADVEETAALLRLAPA